MKRAEANGMTIRRATDADLPAILEIYNDAVLKTTATYDTEPQLPAARAVWFAEHQREGLPVYVAEVEGEVAGWSSLSHYYSRPGYRYTVEDSLYIAEARRGRGIGKRLLAPLVDEARSLGKHAILARIDAGSEASIRLHAGFGFERVGYLKQVGYKFERWVDVVYMELLI
jgi:phosphinothricin acetyltransferase